MINILQFGDDIFKDKKFIRNYVVTVSIVLRSYEVKAMTHKTPKKVVYKLYKPKYLK